MTLQQLKYVIAIADRESISEAAKDLYISQPTLSNAVKELEKEYGISIFNRSNKGIMITAEGMEFLGYARQVIEQSSLLEKKYGNMEHYKVKFGVSTQHYSFAVNAFSELIKEYGMEEYDFSLRETRTYEIIEDVSRFVSEIGVIYLNDFNKNVISRMLSENELGFTELVTAKPHVFISKNNPLAQKKVVTLEDLAEYPCLSFEQGNYNSFYFSEEILSTISHKKNIKVSDRATLFNLLIGVNGYTISSGIINEEFNGENIIAVPLASEEDMHIGYITRKNVTLSRFAEKYIYYLKNILS